MKEILYVLGRFTGMFMGLVVFICVVALAFWVGIQVVNSQLHGILKTVIIASEIAFFIASWFAYDVATGKVSR